jgi:hypothetical protein
MELSGDVPAGTGGSRSLSLPFIGGVTDGGHLYKVISPGVNDTMYVRYYIKYPTNGILGHSGIWMGGFNPVSYWPNPQSGKKPNGDDRFIAAGEQNQLLGSFDHYNYWMAMHASADGYFWGDFLLNNRSVQATRGQWVCVEEMVKLNNPTTAFNGEHALWINGVKVSHLGPGFPNGYWAYGIFTQDPSGSPFEVQVAQYDGPQPELDLAPELHARQRRWCQRHDAVRSRRRGDQLHRLRPVTIACDRSAVRPKAHRHFSFGACSLNSVTAPGPRGTRFDASLRVRDRTTSRGKSRLVHSTLATFSADIYQTTSLGSTVLLRRHGCCPGSQQYDCKRNGIRAHCSSARGHRRACHSRR